MALKAMNRYVLVKLEELVLKTPSGLFLDPKDIQVTAIVVSAGSLCESKVRPGDRILTPRGLQFEKYKDADDGETYAIILEDRILLVLNDGENNGS